jgi:DNA-binding NarL/FixJ family response regulator
MIVYFEPSDYYAEVENLFHAHQIPSKGWRSYESFSENVRRSHPNVVILGLCCRESARFGLEALRILKKNFPRTKAVVISSCPSNVLKAFRLGADGCLLSKELAQAVPYLLSIGTEDSPSSEVYMSCGAQRAIVQALTPFERIQLNTREAQIIQLAANDNSGPQIAKILNLSAQTVETYLKNIKVKFDCHTIQGVVAKAIRGNMIHWEEAMS